MKCSHVSNYSALQFICIIYHLRPSHLFILLFGVDVSDQLPPYSPILHRLPRQSLLHIPHPYFIFSLIITAFPHSKSMLSPIRKHPRLSLSLAPFPFPSFIPIFLPSNASSQNYTCIELQGSILWNMGHFKWYSPWCQKQSHGRELGTKDGRGEDLISYPLRNKEDSFQYGHGSQLLLCTHIGHVIILIMP